MDVQAIEARLETITVNDENSDVTQVYTKVKVRINYTYLIMVLS